MADNMKSDKVRFDYTTIGLVKADGIVTFDGKGINDIADCKDYLANYGLFVVLTRSLAGHEKDTLAEKKAIVKDNFQWFLAGMPKREKGAETLGMKIERVGNILKEANNTLASLETALKLMKDKTGKETLENVISKLKAEIILHETENTRLGKLLLEKINNK